jgi:Tfp pilus assembly protein PilF
MKEGTQEGKNVSGKAIQLSFLPSFLLTFGKMRSLCMMINHRSLFGLLTLVLLFAGCTVPKIVVLHDPLSADEHVRLGTIYEAQGKTDLAMNQYREAVRQDKRHVRAWSLLGDVAYRLEVYAAAQDAYEAALELDPGSGDLHNNLAWVYARQDRKLGKTRELVERAMELTPDHRPYYLDTLGVVLLKQGKIREAIASLEESVATIPSDQHGMLAEAYQHLAEAYEAAGDRERAEQALAEHRRLKQRTAQQAAPEQ